MSYQFAHLETFSRKANTKGQSTDFVFDEASRVPEASMHVEHPEEPVLVYGMGLDELRAEHDRLASEARTTNVKGQSRAIRKDQHTLATVILSHPGGDAADVEAWQKDSVAWLHERYGDRLKTVIRHDDESHPHLHAYLLDPDMKAKNLHPGAQAKAEVMKADPKANKEGDQAYRAAMRAWQDDYWQKVGLKHGLARLGPGKRRLSRAAWKAEQQATQAVKEAHDFADDLRQSAMTDSARHSQQMAAAHREVERLRVEAARAVEAAKVEHDKLARERGKVREWFEDAKGKLLAFRERLRAEKADIDQERQELDQAKASGGVWRRRLLGWFEASPEAVQEVAEKKVRAEMQSQVDAAKSEKYREQSGRLDAERRNHVTQETNRKLVRENLELREKVKPKAPAPSPEEPKVQGPGMRT